MKSNALKHAFALGLAAVMALGATGVASAKSRAKDYVGVWQLNDRGDSWGRDRGQGWNDRDRGRQGEWNDRDHGRQGGWNDRDSRYDSRGGFRAARLPETFRIERDRREFRLESLDGRLLREMDAGRNRQLRSERNVFGATVVETYSLVDNGRRLMIRTTFRGSQGTREMTRLYQRA